MSKQFEQAGLAFKKQAECYIQLDSKHEAASAWQAAATAYQKVAPQESIACLTRAVELFVDQGRFQIAAKHEQQIGELLEETGDMEQAMAHYQTAADYFEGEGNCDGKERVCVLCRPIVLCFPGQASAASKVKLKVADHCALTEKYARAIEIYEETGIAYLANNLLKYSAKNLFFQAGICHLCSEDLVAAKRAVERYQDLDVTFSNQRECKFLLKLIECCESYNSDGLTMAVRDFNQITPLDNWKTTLLLRVKNSIGSAGQNEDLT